MMKPTNDNSRPQVAPETAAHDDAEPIKSRKNRNRFVAFHPSDVALTLLRRHPKAFCLLTLIAARARWTPCQIERLDVGESMIGDYKAAGLRSESVYRHAKKVLKRSGLVTFRTTTNGGA